MLLVYHRGQLQNALSDFSKEDFWRLFQLILPSVLKNCTKIGNLLKGISNLLTENVASEICLSNFLIPSFGSTHCMIQNVSIILKFWHKCHGYDILLIKNIFLFYYTK